MIFAISRKRRKILSLLPQRMVKDIKSKGDILFLQLVPCIKVDQEVAKIIPILAQILFKIQSWTENLDGFLWTRV